MNKIIQLALGLSYPANKLSALQEVIDATPNQQMATEILLGVYEKPKISSKVKNKDGQVRIAKSIDYWRETVTYTYLENKRIGAYYPKDTNEKQLNDSNWQKLKCDSNQEGARYLYFTSDEKQERQSDCSFGEWLSCENIAPQRQLEDLYGE